MKIYKAKKIYTVDNDFSCEEAMAVDGDKIIGLGDLDSLINKYPTATINYDYQEQYIYLVLLNLIYIFLVLQLCLLH